MLDTIALFDIARTADAAQGELLDVFGTPAVALVDGPAETITPAALIEGEAGSLFGLGRTRDASQGELLDVFGTLAA